MTEIIMKIISGGNQPNYIDASETLLYRLAVFFQVATVGS